jgi:YebC/PmpR family DNA-binding regulatory protein
MAGHSQFKNIMHRKGAQDQKRARIFARLAREIMVAAKAGVDPSSNPRLRSALASARVANMPRDNIERAIKKATGEGADTQFFEIRYEGYGPNGTAVIVEVLTDNKNRTASEIRSFFTKFGGALGETGSVAFMFNHIGILRFPKSIAFDDLFEEAVNCGADNVEEQEDALIVTCSFDQYAAVRDALIEKFHDPLEASVIWDPVNTTSLDEENAQKFLKFIDVVENNDDVQNVFSNADISDSILEKIHG